MLLSINQISELTGQDRRTIGNASRICRFSPAIKTRICTLGRSVPLIYAMDSLEAARAAQARSQASLNAVREEDYGSNASRFRSSSTRWMRSFRRWARRQGREGQKPNCRTDQ